ERVVGVVTRSDILRALGEPAEEPPEAEERIAAELAQLERLQPVFEAVSAVGEHFDGVYLVGGTVRDILLGEPSFDVDVAVEGDAVAFAEALAEALGGRVRAHRKFGTAVVLHGEGGRVDVVTARTEFYDAPAALPTVEHATIREDLFRRDFTINAMAVSLKGEDFGGLVGDLSSARLRDELVALLEEEDAGASIRRLAELGVDRAIHPHLAADEEAVALLGRLRAVSYEYGLGVPAWRLGLEALARRMS